MQKYMPQEVVPFQDIYVQLLDMVNPKKPSRITLSDLKKCGMAHAFFNTLLNFNKFISYEQREPIDPRES